MEQLKVLQITLLESEMKKMKELKGEGSWRDLIVGWINETVSSVQEITD